MRVGNHESVGVTGKKAPFATGERQITEGDILGRCNLEGVATAGLIAAVKDCALAGGRGISGGDAIRLQDVVVKRDFIDARRQVRIGRIALSDEVVGAENVVWRCGLTQANLLAISVEPDKST